MAAPDPDEADVDYFEADRLPKVRRRAEVIDQAADLLMDDAFDPGATWDAANEAGVSDLALDAAGHVALILRQIEIRGPDSA
jgi:hypothetical protein